MKARATWLYWLIPASCIGFLVIGLSCLYAGEESVGEFYFNPDPQQKILVAEFIGAATGLGTSYTLYADGRLEIYEINYKFEKTGTTRQHLLTLDEATALIHEAVSARLLEWNDERIQSEIRKTRSSPYIVNDGSTMRLKLRLENYRKPGAEAFEPAAVTIVFGNPTIVAGRYPDIAAIQSLAEIAKRLRVYNQIAKEVGDEN